MEQIIQIPDTLRVKEIKDNKIILVEKEKDLTYENIAKELFANNDHTFYTNDSGHIIDCQCRLNYAFPSNCTSRRQAEKLLAINKLMNVAKYLNGDWQPNWDDKITWKWYLIVFKGELTIDCTRSTQFSNIAYFKSLDIAKQAIEILGEETIKLAFCTDY